MLSFKYFTKLIYNVAQSLVYARTWPGRKEKNLSRSNGVFAKFSWLDYFKILNISYTLLILIAFQQD